VEIFKSQYCEIF